MCFSENEKHFVKSELLVQLRIKLLIFMQSRAKRVSLVQLYNWSVPCTWSPFNISLIIYLLLNNVLIHKTCRRQTVSGMKAQIGSCYKKSLGNLKLQFNCTIGINDLHSVDIKSSHQTCSLKESILQIFVIFTKKHTSWSLF